MINFPGPAIIRTVLESKITSERFYTLKLFLSKIFSRFSERSNLSSSGSDFKAKVGTDDSMLLGNPKASSGMARP